MTISASESGEIHPGNNGAVSQIWDFRAQKCLLRSASLALCTVPDMGFQAVIIMFDPVTGSWIRGYLGRGVSQLIDHNNRKYRYPSSRLRVNFPSYKPPGSPCLSGETQGKATPQEVYQKIYVEQWRECRGSVFNYTLWFATQTSLCSSLPASCLGFQAVLQQWLTLSQVLAAHSIVNTNSRKLEVWNMPN